MQGYRVLDLSDARLIREFSMLGGTAISLIEKVVDSSSEEGKNFRSTVKVLLSHPIKLIASYFTAPFLLFRIALNVKSPVRRWIAIVGIFLSVVAAYVAGTFLGTLAGLALVTTKIGFLFGIGFLVGSFVSILFTVLFQLLVLNFISYLFLKLNTQEVIDYLNEIST